MTLPLPLSPLEGQGAWCRVSVTENSPSPALTGHTHCGNPTLLP